MKRLFCILLWLLATVPAGAEEIAKGDWTGSDDCRSQKGDCFAQTLHVDNDLGQYRLVIRFVIGQFGDTGNFQAGFEAALVPKEGEQDAAIKKIVFHTEGPPASFKTHKSRTNADGVRYTESFSLFKKSDAAIAELVDYMKGAEALRVTLVIEREGKLAARDIELSLKGSAHVLKKAFGKIAPVQ